MPESTGKRIIRGMIKEDRHELVMSLSEREKATLRLLLVGHDAKSIAQALGLSVHTVNERLRDSRRKLGVSSSREAARLLAEAEQSGPNSLGDKQIGVVGSAGRMEQPGRSITRPTAENLFAGRRGGLIIMSLLAAALATTSLLLVTQAQQKPVGVAAPSVAAVAETAETKSARDWLALLDAERWDDSWTLAGAAFRVQTKASWATTGQQVRRPLGKAGSRTLLSVTKTTSLPGAPPGEYEVIQFQTSFAQKPNAVETVVLTREELGWKVNGYFIQ